jgi:hypothetical protein
MHLYLTQASVIVDFAKVGPGVIEQQWMDATGTPGGPSQAVARRAKAAKKAAP